MITVVATGEVLQVRPSESVKGRFVNVKLASDGNTVHAVLPPELKSEVDLQEGDLITVIGDQKTTMWEKDGAPRKSTTVMVRHLRINHMVRKRGDKLPAEVQDWVNAFDEELERYKNNPSARGTTA